MLKLVYAVARRPDLEARDFYDYWLKSHGPRVKRHAAAIGARRYIQSHTIDTPANEGLRAARGMAQPIAGITEVWWDSLEAFDAAYATSAGAEASADLSEDEAKFIDISASQVFLTREHEIFDRRGGRPDAPGAPKCVYLLARKPPLSLADCHTTWLLDHGPLVTSHAQTLGMSRYVQSHTFAPDRDQAIAAARGFAEPPDGLTEVWFPSNAALEAGSATSEGRAAGAALVEDEKRFVDMPRSRCFLAVEHVIF